MILLLANRIYLTQTNRLKQWKAEQQGQKTSRNANQMTNKFQPLKLLNFPITIVPPYCEPSLKRKTFFLYFYSFEKHYSGVLMEIVIYTINLIQFAHIGVRFIYLFIILIYT